MTMRVAIDGLDPIEQTIARGIVKAMAGDGLNYEKSRKVGEFVAEAVSAYRKAMSMYDLAGKVAEATSAAAARKPGPFDNLPTVDEIRDVEKSRPACPPKS